MADTDDEIALINLIRPEEEALRLKNLAEQKYTSNNLKSALRYAKRALKLHPSLDGLSELLTAFRILHTASTPVFPVVPGSNSAATPDYYKILDVERFSHINTIKKQYKKLALTLHPDKNPFVASEEAFKLVAEAVRVLSDKIRRKEYDMKLRIAMQSEAEAVGVSEAVVETFWTSCSTCRLLHKFERKYLGHNLMCPSCKKSFKAVEVVEDNEKDEGVGGGATKRVSARIQDKVAKGGYVGVLEKFGLGVKRKVRSIEEVMENSEVKMAENVGGDVGGSMKGLRSKRVEKVEGFNESRRDCHRSDTNIVNESDGVEIVESKREKRGKAREEESMTLAQMQVLAKKKKVNAGKSVLKEKEANKNLKPKDKEEEKVMAKETEKETEDETEKENETVNTREKRDVHIPNYRNLEVVHNEKENEKEKEIEKEMMITREKRERHRVSKYSNLEVLKDKMPANDMYLDIEKLKSLKKRNLVIMPVEDSDFHDFDKDRSERSFKKGQVWALYDDDDGMPRHYALIDKIVSLSPFEVTLSWLQYQSTGDEKLISWQEMGFRVSCGRYKVSYKVSIKYLNLFSHVLDCERAAREVYMIYPNKGSVWALYNDKKQRIDDKRCYDIVVSLSSYSDVYGVSIAYLDKVDGFRTVFKRREVGAHAVMWLGKDDIKLFSHQIPAKKLSGEEALNLPKDCWELDPASLTP
ncbi:hypothetical protein ACJIZ3_001858 [Penstemon smallii]|uniref:J domain-containing protein n=1 Tax=Penstemon smallii TaxID=265156 RepID=A0ABD3U654_9LAMI